MNIFLSAVGIWTKENQNPESSRKELGTEQIFGGCQRDRGIGIDVYMYPLFRKKGKEES